MTPRAAINKGKVKFLFNFLGFSKTKLKDLWRQSPKRTVIYKEEVRDRLNDPLATNYKLRLSPKLENRCQILILTLESEEYKLTENGKKQDISIR